MEVRCINVCMQKHARLGGSGGLGACSPSGESRILKRGVPVCD